MNVSDPQHTETTPPRAARPRPVAHASADLCAERLNQLKELYPEAVTEGQVDWDALRAALGGAVNDGPERYSFGWAGKRDSLRALQTPSTASLTPDEAASVRFADTGHVFVEGDNLEVLKLLHKSYFGRVKLIYIDPPYNTGTEFIYPDNYSAPLASYLELTGQQDAQGNLRTSRPETSGRYHSAWLSMMYPRLVLARQLLRDDGVIFISIDDHELHNLRAVMNEIFGEENFVANVVWQKKYAPANDKLDFSYTHDYIMVYGKRRTFAESGKALALLGRNERTELQDKLYKNPDNDSRGPWASDNYTCNKTSEQRSNLYYPIKHPKTGDEIWPSKTRVWAYSEPVCLTHIRENRIWWGANQENGTPRFKRFLSDVKGVVSGTWWGHKEVGHNGEAKKQLQDLFPEAAQVFDTPKPTRLLRRILKLATVPDDVDGDLVLDFFAGSGTTAQAVLEQNRADGGNRRFILVQLPEPTGGPLLTIADMAAERVRRVIARLEGDDADRNGVGQGDMASDTASEDLGMRVFRLAPSHFRTWAAPAGTTDADAYLDQLEMLADPLVQGWTPAGVLWEVAVREGLSLTARVERLPVGENVVWRIVDSDRDQVLHVCLDEAVTPAVVRGLGLGTADLFVCRDAALTDKAAANLALECRLKTL